MQFFDFADRAGMEEGYIVGVPLTYLIREIIPKSQEIQTSNRKNWVPTPIENVIDSSSDLHISFLKKERPPQKFETLLLFRKDTTAVVLENIFYKSSCMLAEHLLFENIVNWFPTLAVTCNPIRNNTRSFNSLS